MGTPAFNNYRALIQVRISKLNDTVESLKKSIVTYTDLVARQIGLPDSQQMLTDFETELDKTNRRIAKLKKFFVTLSNKWSKLADRVIGHVVWAPPIGVGPNRFTRDVCIVELYKSKFPHSKGNVLSLGTTLVHHSSSMLVHDYPFSLLFQDPRSTSPTSRASCTSALTFPLSSNIRSMVFSSLEVC